MISTVSPLSSNISKYATAFSYISIIMPIVPLLWFLKFSFNLTLVYNSIYLLTF